MSSERGRVPSLFVSSTCFDLKQIRNDLKIFIENQLGYEVLLSEFDSFPLDPSINTVENCLRIVQERADIFILIIGGRYGNTTDYGKSVTNLEYLKAEDKGIPIYAFVDKSIISILPVWEKNKTADFSSVVDSNQLFEFVKSLRSEKEIWVYDFEKAQDIIHTLQKQLAYLFYDGLCLKKKLNSENLSKELLKLDPKALGIILVKPAGWEYKLFGAILESGFVKHKNLKRNYKFEICYEKNRSFDNIHDCLEIIIDKMKDFSRYLGILDTLFHSAFIEAIGNPGEPGDPEYIVYVAEQIIDTYTNIIEWGIDFKRFEIPEKYKEVMNDASELSMKIISGLENMIISFNKEIEKIPNNIAMIDLSREIKINLSLPTLSNELHQISKKVDEIIDAEK